MRIEESEIIPATTRPLRHGVGLARGTVGKINPIGGTSQWGLAISGGLVVLQRRWQERQGRFGQGFVVALALRVHAPEDGKWFAPVTLTTEEPIAKFVVDGFIAEILGLEPTGDFLLRLGRRQTIQRNFAAHGIDRKTVIDITVPILSGWRLHNL